MNNKKMIALVLGTLSIITLTIYRSFIFRCSEANNGSLIFKPNGTPAHNMDRLMLINAWAHHVDDNIKKTENKSNMIFAGIGKPSFILNNDLAQAASNYWQERVKANKKLTQTLSSTTLSDKDKADEVAKNSTAIDYGNLAGEFAEREIMAKALSIWYKKPIDPSEIIFTVGGLGALTILFKVINEKKPNGRIITTVPYYPAYNNETHKNNLHLIDMMKEPGYCLTAHALQKGIDSANALARRDGKNISAFLFCDPNNPLGSVVSYDEWAKIARVLQNTPSDIPIILDEAYAELVCDNEQHISLFTVAPELKERIIVMRSTTKGFSASGERMAVLVCSNQTLREDILNEALLAYLHMPRSLQYAYSQAMLNFTPEKQMQLSNHYSLQTKFVQKRLREIGIQMPDPLYSVKGTFYVLADLSCLLGTKIAQDARKVFGKSDVITNDEQLCYSLLFDEHIMICPLSYFGLDAKLGYVRITCTGGIAELTDLMDRLENKIKSMRFAD